MKGRSKEILLCVICTYGRRQLSCSGVELVEESVLDVGILEEEQCDVLVKGFIVICQMKCME